MGLLLQFGVALHNFILPFGYHLLLRRCHSADATARVWFFLDKTEPSCTAMVLDAMRPGGNLLAWVEPCGADEFIGAFIGEGAC